MIDIWRHQITYISLNLYKSIKIIKRKLSRHDPYFWWSNQFATICYCLKIPPLPGAVSHHVLCALASSCASVGQASSLHGCFHPSAQHMVPVHTQTAYRSLETIINSFIASLIISPEIVVTNYLAVKSKLFKDWLIALSRKVSRWQVTILDLSGYSEGLVQDFCSILLEIRKHGSVR